MYIEHDKEICLRNNWTKITSDAEKLFESWKTRNLTMFGKVCIINSIVVSKIIYLASILNLPGSNVIKDLQRIIYNFIWKKKDRIKRNTLIGPIDNGGIGVVDILSKMKSLRALWIKQILNKRNPLYDFVNSICIESNYDFDYLIKTNLTIIKDYEIMDSFPLFYKEMLVFFNECKKINTFGCLNDVLKEPLWSNNSVCCSFIKTWLESGLRYVNDIIDENGIKPSEWFTDKL
jgi:hypothetical protein